MVLSEWEHAAGMREFRLRSRYRRIVFEPGKGWWMHCLDAREQIVDCYRLAFSDVESELREQPNALQKARGLERVTAPAPARSS
jgi:hypothetical protein